MKITIRRLLSAIALIGIICIVLTCNSRQPILNMDINNIKLIYHDPHNFKIYEGVVAREHYQKISNIINAATIEFFPQKWQVLATFIINGRQNEQDCELLVGLFYAQKEPYGYFKINRTYYKTNKFQELVKIIERSEKKEWINPNPSKQILGSGAKRGIGASLLKYLTVRI